ncbi:PepSY domain-containing protein [Acaryochloris sp. IP29b_bin.148]|uniref:PepSY domain-containing protein n=1 Tax=Acaryochloris sp. IP29b_bin.148 TaxID=2969218 RepID=UPI00260DF90C|nr:PepSY domain-containing protein [Acaryochloris sp. IP29b_bin.148]
MAINKAQIRRLHYRIAPLWVLPLVLTSLSGSLYHVTILMGTRADFLWLVEIHKGNFGPLRLEIIYPFINTFAVLMLAGTGITMWLQTPRRKRL